MQISSPVCVTIPSIKSPFLMAAVTRFLTALIIVSVGLVWPPMEPTSALITDKVIFILRPLGWAIEGCAIFPYANKNSLFSTIPLRLGFQMKVSIAWIFDHIDADLQKIDIPALIQKINETTAEIEGSRTIKTDLSCLALGQFKKGTVFIPEWNERAAVSKRTDAQEGSWYLMAKDDDGYRWATSIDLGGSKEMLLPAIHEGEKLADGSWKKSFEISDTIFTIDNKSITHRPDLWGHRGFAREVAAILDLPLKPLDDFVAHKKIVPHEHKTAAGKNSPFSMMVDTDDCKRFAGLSVSKMAHAPSLLWMVTRLSRVDSRSIDALVDFTNYVMLDIGQPMHAFDADKLSSKSIGVRKARNKEKLELLDDQTIELSDHDIVITDGDHPISLAGIMGGKSSAISPQTTALFLESANFDAATIRRSSFAHKLRSEASARFEKGLDPNQNTTGIERFLKLLDDAAIAYIAADEIESIGALAQPTELTITHCFIESRLGTSLAPEFVIETLRKIGFEIREDKKEGEKSLLYRIVVPPFRALKDIGIKEDIVEEVGRFYGWGNITPELPSKTTQPTPLHAITQTRRIKRLLSYGLAMQELYLYAFFDESFLRELDWDPAETLRVKDPVSENWHRLVTTLIPNMLKAVSENCAAYDELKFYEWARVWHGTSYQESEKKSLAGIWYSKKKNVDFYQGKADLQTLFQMMGLKVEWQPVSPDAPWYDAAQTAHIMANGTSIGTAGMADRMFLKNIADGDAFIFELDAAFLESYKKPLVRYQAASKFPAIERDVSVLVPLSLTVAHIQQFICDTSDTIKTVELVDMFQKKEWKSERALTFRYRLQDKTKTMTKAEAEKISAQVIKEIESAGGSIR